MCACPSYEWMLRWQRRAETHKAVSTVMCCGVMALRTGVDCTPALAMYLASTGSRQTPCASCTQQQPLLKPSVPSIADRRTPHAHMTCISVFSNNSSMPIHISSFLKSNFSPCMQLPWWLRCSLIPRAAR